MITSIVVTDCYSIGMNSSGKIKVNDNVLSVEKDIPFIRYRFDAYDDAKLDYISKMMEQFKYSTHLAEIKMDDNTKDVVAHLADRFTNVAKYIYIDVTDEDVERGMIQPKYTEQLKELASIGIDRVMFKDKSTSLNTVYAKSIIKSAKNATGINEDDFGICGSPLSFGEMCCLTAVKARELMSLYSTVADVALPSANHQCMNCCGCIRYMVVSDNLLAPADAKVKGGSSNSGEAKEKSDKVAKPKNKPSLQLNSFSL